MFSLKQFRFWLIALCTALLGIIVSVVTYFKSLNIRCGSDSAYPLEALFNTKCASASPSHLFQQSLLWLLLLSIITFCLSIVAIALLVVRKIMHNNRVDKSNHR